jgi:hypothetical protein|tara:strand:+ start:587 stop:784 length:198 start_codon:yes stop_codon:yes gene_type:complete
MENLDKQFLTTQELADRWRKSKRTLENQRGKGVGVDYIKIDGKVLYDIETIIAYENQSKISNNAI